MSYINVGALYEDNNVPTKKALREAMKTHPEKVLFYGTSMFNEGATFRGNRIPHEVKLSVVGPDPFNNRKWYATVSEGKVS